MTLPAFHDLPPARVLRVGRAWVAENAIVTGRVTLGEDASLWFGVVVRGDDAPIRIGARTNVQDGTVVHVDPDREHVIGEDVTVGHAAILHGVRIHDLALIGMGAKLLAGSVVGEGAVVGAGAVVSEGMEVPPYTLAVGVPARIARPLDVGPRREEALWMSRGYVVQAGRHAKGLWQPQVDV